MNILTYELDLLPASSWHFFDATPTTKDHFVYLQEIGHFFAQKKYFTTRQGLDSFLVKLTLSGAGILEYEGHIQQVAQGHFFWIDCMQHQHYYTDPAVGHWDMIWVHFRGATARAYYEAFRKLNGDMPVGKLPEGSPMYTLHEMLLSRVSISDEYAFLEQNLFKTDIWASAILTQLMVSCISVTGSSNEPVSIPAVVQEIRKYLAAHFDQKITLEHLAKIFNLDPFYLQKLFKRYIGQSPSQYIIYLRMAQAKLLMRTTASSISEIAYAVGIDNISHFTRQFKKFESMTPVQYRKIWRGDL